MGDKNQPKLRVLSAHQRLPAADREIGKLLVAVSLLTVAFLSCFLAWTHLFPPVAVQPSPTALSHQHNLAQRNLSAAMESLEGEVRQAERMLDAALFTKDETTLLAFLTLQAESAGMGFGQAELTPLPRDGVIQPVELSFAVEGSFYDLPIFLDGLFRQRSVIVLETLSVSSKAPLSPHVDTRVTARLYRPVRPSGHGLVALAANEMRAMDAGSRGALSAALQHAANLEAMDGFRSEVARLTNNSDSNRQRVMETLPRILKALPGAPYGHVSVDLRSPRPKIQTDEPGPP